MPARGGGGIARLQFKRRQSGQVKHQRHVSRVAQGTERGKVWGRGVRLPTGGGVWGGGSTLPRKFLLFDLKMEHFRAVFKLDLTEETRTQLQEEEAIASSCLILPTPPMDTRRPGGNVSEGM